MKSNKGSDEADYVFVVGRCNDACPGRAFPIAGSGPDAGALLLEVSVGRKCDTAHL